MSAARLHVHNWPVTNTPARYMSQHLKFAGAVGTRLSTELLCLPRRSADAVVFGRKHVRAANITSGYLHPSLSPTKLP